MEVAVDGEFLFKLTDIQKQVIQNDICSYIFEADMRRRLEWVLLHEKYHKCMQRLKNEWADKLAERYESVPTHDEALAKIIFSQKDYKNRTQRDIEDIAQKYPQMKAELGEDADRAMQTMFGEEKFQAAMTLIENKAP